VAIAVAASNIPQGGFTDNFADDNGGAVSTAAALTLAGDTFGVNEAEDNGGALYVTGGNVTLDTTAISLNEADTGTGGGIFRSAGTVSFVNNDHVRFNRPNNCTGVTCPA
jgi:predicted outer membrane repeat protein